MSSHLNVECYRALLKHFNKDLKPLAEADIPNRGAQLFGEDIGKRAKSMADNVIPCKLNEQQSFFRERRLQQEIFYPKPQSRRSIWGVTPASRKSESGRLDTIPKKTVPEARQARSKRSEKVSHFPLLCPLDPQEVFTP